MSDFATLQHWLGALIAQPLQPNHFIPSLTPFGTGIEDEAEKFIAPSPTLKSHERIQIYHQQYWWRLLKCLRTQFPTLVRLFGEEVFHSEIAIPYLSQHPPADWSLSQLGKTLPVWLKEHYVQEDCYLIQTCAAIDWATEEAFSTKKILPPPFSEWTSEETLSKPLILQPDIYLFDLEGDFFSFRDEFLKQEPVYYNTNPFPSMTYGKFYFVLYRTQSNVVKWIKISGAEQWMLSQFKEGNSIEGACARLEESQGEFLEEALALIPFWFKQWTVLEWLGQF